MNRKVLASLLVIGAVGVIAAGSTFALFNDTETSDTNTFESGALDLQIDWVETYNGEVVEEQEFTDNPGSIFDISDVKPGDEGQANISLHVFDNPAYVNMTMEQTASYENGCTEPESQVDDSCGDEGEGEGELGEHLEFTIEDNDGNVVFDGTAEELNQQNINLGLVDNSTTEYVTIDWRVPRETGNVIQTDSKHFRFDFSAVQARHNGQQEDVPGEDPVAPPEDNDTDDDFNVTPPGDDNDTDDDDFPPTDDNDTNDTDDGDFPPIDGNDTDNGDDNDTDDNVTNVTATLDFRNQTTNGTFVNIDEADLSEGGFVTIYDEDGDLRGASEYIEPDMNESFSVEFDSRLNMSQWMEAQAFRDTDDDEDFDADEDSSYVVNGSNVTDDAYINVTNETNGDNDTNVANASVNFENQTSNGSEVTVEEVNTSDGGFVAIMTEAENLIGVSDYLDSGALNDVMVDLSTELNTSQWLNAQVYQDSDNDQEFNRSEDEPYTDNGTNVADDAFINITNETNGDNDTDNGTDNGTDGDTETQGINTVWFCDNGTDDDSPCPSGERSVATVEWNGTNFEPVQVADDANVDINLTARFDEGRLLEVRWFSGNELESVVSQSNGDTCTSPGGTSGVARACEVPSTIEIDETLPAVGIDSDEE